MNNPFLPLCTNLLIGSMPVKDHELAGELVNAFSPDIPVWVQLPVNAVEGMVPQFLPGMPGVATSGDKTFVNTHSDDFETALVEFYEQYLGVCENTIPIDESIFAMTPEVAQGFFVLLKNLAVRKNPPKAVKGQITGPFTFTTSVKDREGRAIFYNEQARDVAIKLLSLKAAWQLARLAAFEVPRIIFIDEPALAGFGSSEFTSISREDVTACLEETITAVHEHGGVAGIHVCGNTDWSLILESSVDIINFDTYGYFDRFILYGEAIKTFMARGGILAWGIVPTLLAEDIDRETADSLAQKLIAQMQSLESLGIARDVVFSQSVISPSCGTGSLDPEHAEKVLKLNQAVSQIIRKNI